MTDVTGFGDRWKEGGEMGDVDLSAFFEGRVQAWGVAPAQSFVDAPEGHRPEDVLRGAASVVVYGIAVPGGIFLSREYSLHSLHRSYHTVYPLLDAVGFELALYLEDRGHLATVIPSYAPLVFRGVEPWGLISLKHAAWLAGLGSFGRSGMVYHPTYGARLRLGAVVTTAELDAGEPLVVPSCPEECRRCSEACPCGALAGEGFDKMACLAHTIRHGIYPVTLRSEEGLRHMELIINTAGYNYWVKCCECLMVCPLNLERA